MTLQETIVATALKYIGETEETGNSGFKNKEFEREMKAVGFMSGHSWCSYLAELVWVTSARKCGFDLLAEEMGQLFSAGAVATWANFNKPSDMKFLPTDTPFPSDLVIFQKYKNGEKHWTGHMGIVVATDGIRMTTVEGNTTVNPQDREGTAVVKKNRVIDFTQKPNGLNLLGFVHIV